MRASLGMGLLILVLLVGCTPSPEPSVIDQAMRDHFMSRGYRVLELKIGSVSRNPLRERAYMAPKTFVVEIPSIVLEPANVAGTLAAGKASRPMAFWNARIEIRSGSGPPPEGPKSTWPKSAWPKSTWIVSSIQGIDIP